MKAANKLIKSITQWAKREEEIRALILLGSHARKGRTDHMSDIDLCLFVTDPAQFTGQQTWLTQFAPVWVSLAKREEDHEAIKVIYEPGLMVEVGIYPLDALVGMQIALPPYLEPGYVLLVDKDKTALNLPKASRANTPPKPPTVETYQAVIQSFWLNVFNTAKYIWRSELWRVKVFDWRLKQDLLQMMGWHAVLCRGQVDFTTYEGKHLEEWTDTETYTDLMAAFGRFYPADSWRALEETVWIFCRLAENVAEPLNTDYPKALESHFTTLIEDLKTNPD